MLTRVDRGWAALAVVALVVVGLAGPARAELPEFTSLVEKYGQTVVNISTKQDAARRGGPRSFNFGELPEDGPFNEFFRRFFGEVPEGYGGPGSPGGVPQFQTESLGSGFIVSSDGYILTNHHVVRGASEIVVRMQDRREFLAELVGSDERSDIALLKVKAEGLPAAKIGNPDRMRVGEWVVAIGSPFGFDHSVTAGIISAIDRSLPRDSYVPFIQTDVAINPGNSGGPLFNMRGEVIGVNSQIYSRTGGFMGLSFAVPVDVAMEVAEQLRENGFVTRGWLGVLIQDVTRELAESLAMNQPSGALVARVIDGSPAAAAGFEVGDVILRFGDHDIVYSSDLPPIVGRAATGSEVEVRILRDGKERTLKVKIEALPEDAAASNGPQPSRSRGPVGVLGMTVRDLSKAQRESLEIEEGGVILSEIGEGPAAGAGLRPGDVILKINATAIASPGQFRKVVEALEPGRPARFLVQRPGTPPRWIAVPIPEGKGKTGD